MRSLPLFVCLCAAVSMVAPSSAAASETATASVAVTATFNAKTSLKVSTQILQFEVTSPEREATAAVEFSAGARTRQSGEVVLTIEPDHAILGPGGAADVDTSLRFAGDGDGIRSGALQSSQPTIAGLWRGSGLRKGRVVFALRAAAPGTYTLPVRFVLTLP
jgi:hypothetical protein